MSTFFEKNKWLKNLIFVVAAWLSTRSLGCIIALNDVPMSYYGGNYFGYNVMSIVYFATTIWLLNYFFRGEDTRRKICAVLGGVLLSYLIVWGAYAHIVNNIFIDAKTTWLQFGLGLGLAVFGIPFVYLLFGWFLKAGNWISENMAAEQGKLSPRVLFFLSWGIIFLCYLPLFLSQWPGNFVFDAKYQLINVQEGWYTTHHPLAHTLLMGWAYKLGVSMGNAAAGYQFYTLIQMAVLTSAFAFCCTYLYKKRAPKWIQIATFLWFALFPMNPVFAISATKDVLCAAFFLYFVIFAARYYVDKETTWQNCVGFVLSGMLTALYRNNAGYAILLAGIISLIFVATWKQKAITLLLVVGIYASSSLTNQVLINVVDAVETDTYRETMSVPLQCLARVAAYRGDELDPAFYEEIIRYIPAEDIGNYNPYCSDGVKNNANEELLKGNTMNFFKLWLKVGLKFPDEYFESIITNTMGYWYPLNQGRYVSPEIALYHTLIGQGEEIEKESYCGWAEKLYSKYFWAQDYQKMPILAYLFRNAPYVWLVLFGTLFAVYKKNNSKLSLLLFPLLYILSCFAGPMAALRYMYCIVVSVPVLAYTLLKKD